MRARKLTFGDRVHCPFLRPFFLTAADEARIRRAAETLAALGERVAREALDLALAVRPARDHRGGGAARSASTRATARASTASRLDAFLLPGGLHFAEYNAESPAGPGYTQRLAELFDALPAMARFRQSTPSGSTRRSSRCSTRCSTATASGAAARSRRRSRSSTGARCRPGPSSRSCATPSSPPACRRSSAIRATSMFDGDDPVGTADGGSTSCTGAC